MTETPERPPKTFPGWVILVLLGVFLAAGLAAFAAFNRRDKAHLTNVVDKSACEYTYGAGMCVKSSAGNWVRIGGAP